MLEIKDLAVDVIGKRIINNLNLHIGEGEVHALLGPNGSGKTSLTFALLGFPGYEIAEGEIVFRGKEITGLPTNERVKKGIGISFQHPPEIRGVKLVDMLRICAGLKEEGAEEEAAGLEGEMKRAAERLKIPAEFMDRDVNLGFSGGEVKKSEILQLLLQNPDFMIFDEPDSGVDVENVELIGKMMSKMLQRDKKPSERRKSALIITHTGFIFNYVKADRAHVLLNGKLACSGISDEIIGHIMREGFEGCVRECQRIQGRDEK
ncbi:MAG: ATP-binding cassette domain-containing protein [Candidatus Methanospirareceae archaeon]